MSETDNRRKSPPCDTHELRIHNLETSKGKMELTLWGEDGRGGMNKAADETNANTLKTGERVDGLRKMVYLFNIPIVLAIVLMAIKYILGD